MKLKDVEYYSDVCESVWNDPNYMIKWPKMNINFNIRTTILCGVKEKVNEKVDMVSHILITS
jgi:hypothetical protein